MPLSPDPSPGEKIMRGFIKFEAKFFLSVFVVGLLAFCVMGGPMIPDVLDLIWGKPGDE